jgi:hypothetical protein
VIWRDPLIGVTGKPSCARVLTERSRRLIPHYPRFTDIEGVS